MHCRWLSICRVWKLNNAPAAFHYAEYYNSYCEKCLKSRHDNDKHISICAALICASFLMRQLSQRTKQTALGQQIGCTRTGSQVHWTCLSPRVANECYMCCHWWKGLVCSTTSGIRKEHLLLPSTPWSSANSCGHFSNHQSYDWSSGQAVTKRNPHGIQHLCWRNWLIFKQMT